jgi:DinB superfamily
MTESKEIAELKKQLHSLLNGGQAHADFESAIKDFPVELRGRKHENLPYSAWQLLEHLRITQRDILDFSAPPTGGYQHREWPAAYWPVEAEPPYPGSWDNAIAEIRSDLKKFEALIDKPEVDLFKPFRWGEGQNLLREALLIADHNAYHLGEFIVLRRLFGAWPA